MWFIRADIHQFGGEQAFREMASIWARYSIGFPGAILSALGLHHQVQKQIKPLNLKRIERPLMLASWSLVAYGVAGGLIVPQANFFPASLPVYNGQIRHTKQVRERHRLFGEHAADVEAKIPRR